MMFPTGVAGVLICGVIASACTQSPIAPSITTAQATGGNTIAASDARITAQDAKFSPADLMARGWDCRPAPTIPNRTTCSPPNQAHPITLPGPPPPPDRPATFTLLVFDSGVFIGTDLLIRSDLYHDQPCASLGGPFRYISRIGYYECVHLGAEG
jgi:hypothetical protein